MILKASTRGNAVALGRHLMNGRDNDLSREDGGMNGLRPHGRIADMGPLAPLLHRRRADSISPRQRPHALFTPRTKLAFNLL